MAVQTINYDDKVYINQNSDIPNINKVNDTDMNEIKSVVNNNATELSNLGTFLNINTFDTVTSGTITGGGTLSSINVTVAYNSDVSLAKIYGQIDVATNTKAGNVTFNSNLRPSSQLTINGIVYRAIAASNTIINNALVSLTIGTDGKITIPYTYATATNNTCRLSIIACVLFIKNFGDTPIS